MHLKTMVTVIVHAIYCSIPWSLEKLNWENIKNVNKQVKKKKKTLSHQQRKSWISTSLNSQSPPTRYKAAAKKALITDMNYSPE